MSALKEIAQYSTELIVATSAMASGSASGIGAVAVPLVTLAAIGNSLSQSCAIETCRKSIDKALNAMEREGRSAFAPEDVQRARDLLKTQGGTIRLDPALMSAKLQEGTFETFARDTVLRALPELSEAGNASVRTILTLAVDAALAVCVDNKEFEAALNQRLLIDAAQAHGVTLRHLARLEKKVDDAVVEIRESSSILRKVQSQLDEMAAAEETAPRRAPPHAGAVHSFDALERKSDAFRFIAAQGANHSPISTCAAILNPAFLPDPEAAVHELPTEARTYDFYGWPVDPEAPCIGFSGNLASSVMQELLHPGFLDPGSLLDYSLMLMETSVSLLRPHGDVYWKLGHAGYCVATDRIGGTLNPLYQHIYTHNAEACPASMAIWGIHDAEDRTDATARAARASLETIYLSSIFADQAGESLGRWSRTPREARYYQKCNLLSASILADTDSGEDGPEDIYGQIRDLEPPEGYPLPFDLAAHLLMGARNGNLETQLHHVQRHLEHKSLSSLPDTALVPGILRLNLMCVEATDDFERTLHELMAAHDDFLGAAEAHRFLILPEARRRMKGFLLRELGATRRARGVFAGLA